MNRPVGYLVHNLNDPAVERRVGQMVRACLSVQLAGHWRTAAVDRVGGQPATALQRSHDGRLVHRASLVLANLISSRQLQAALEPCGVLVARNLEMLVLAAWLRQPGQRLIYECLDIHRTLFRTDSLGAAMRRLERALLDRCDGVITSSPAFAANHFGGVQDWQGPIAVIENKLAAGAHDGLAVLRTHSPPQPWKVGWFGMLRCARSLELLRRLVLARPGEVEVHMAGVPAYSELPDFDHVVAATPGLFFAGRYTAADLPVMYTGVHFAWCIDWFEQGQNSAWLLPNRLYESIACGCVPLAETGQETAAWLDRNGAGITLAEPAEDIAALLRGLTMADYARLKQQVLALPLERVVETDKDPRMLAAFLDGTTP